jgi:hypothetical protein
MTPLEKADLLQGTLDLLILKVVALGPIHGYGISQRIHQISKACSWCSRDHSIPHCTAWSSEVGSRLSGESRKRTAGKVLPAVGKRPQAALGGTGDLDPAIRRDPTDPQCIAAGGINGSLVSEEQQN